MEEKPFEKWSRLKRELHTTTKNSYFKEREIWYCSLGINIGHEQDGKNQFFERPVIILKKFNNDTCWRIPLTSKRNYGREFFSWKFINNKESTALFEHLRSFDKKRLQRKVSQVPQSSFKRLSRKLRRVIYRGN